MAVSPEIDKSFQFLVAVVLKAFPIHFLVVSHSLKKEIMGMENIFHHLSVETMGAPKVGEMKIFSQMKKLPTQ